MKKILIIAGKNKFGGPFNWLLCLADGLAKSNSYKLEIRRPSFRLILSLRQYTIIHIYEFSFYSLFIEKIAGCLKIPKVATVHGDFIGASDNLNIFKKIISKYLAISGLKEADIVTTPTLYMKNLIKKIGVIDPEKIKVIPNMVNLGLFVKRKPNNKRRLTVVQISDFKYLLKAKGVIDSVKAFLHFGSKAQLRIIGGRGLINYFKCHFAGNNIIYLGRISHRDVIKELRAADIFIFPTYFDNAPISILEAMATGLPILTYNTGGIKELIGQAGIICNKKNLSHWIDKLISNKTLRSVLADKARRRATHFSHKKISKSFMLLYNSLQDE